jgi:anti-sigma regulatory factor (Ser/Thr protein kinase)
MYLWHITGMASGTTISLCHRAGDDLSRALRPALVEVHEFAGRIALDAAMTRRLAIVAEELLVNLLEHGASSGPSGALNAALQIDQTPERLELMLEDDGPSFDPRGAEPADMPNMDRGGGVGLALVKAFAQIDSYASAGGVNRLCLRMNRRREDDG